MKFPGGQRLPHATEIRKPATIIDADDCFTIAASRIAFGRCVCIAANQRSRKGME